MKNLERHTSCILLVQAMPKLNILFKSGFEFTSSSICILLVYNCIYEKVVSVSLMLLKCYRHNGLQLESACGMFSFVLHKLAP